MTKLYILDETDNRTGSHTPGFSSGCSEKIPAGQWDSQGDPMARGFGEPGGCWGFLRAVFTVTLAKLGHDPFTLTLRDRPVREVVATAWRAHVTN